MLTDKELQVLLNHISNHFDNQWQRIAQLEKQVQELTNGSREASKPKTGGSKRIQQAQEDA